MGLVAFIVLVTILLTALRAKQEESKLTTPRGRTILLHQKLFPFWTEMGIVLLYVVLITALGARGPLVLLFFGAAWFWAWEAGRCLKREGERHLRLRGILEIPHGFEVVPERSIVLLSYWVNMPSKNGRITYPTRKLYRPGDIFEPDPNLPEAECIRLKPGERRTVVVRLPLIGQRNVQYINYKGGLFRKVGKRADVSSAQS